VPDNNSDFISAAASTYVADPRRFGFAFWKYRELLRSARATERVFNGALHRYAISKRRLVFYWSDDDQLSMPAGELAECDLLFINAKYHDQLACLEDTHETHQGRALIFDNSFTETATNSDYYTDSFRPAEACEFEAAVRIINGSMPGGGNMRADEVRAFTRLPVYDPTLWVWVKERRSHQPVSIGISVYDKDLRHAELEWIYVLPDHQRRGVGRTLLGETIGRARSKSELIRVGGIADEFYMKCGFSIRTDEHLWVTRRGTCVGWWE
jgi:GNAT superfamily N-acetyltransferase